ncbi:MAG: DNA methyltransferase [Candidatus Korobacteraceae bacterium]|jgi:hypothetical protein
MSVTRHHAEWLSLLEVSGPFLSMPVLLKVFPQGLDVHDPEISRALRFAYEEWDDDQTGKHPNPAVHGQFIRFVLTGVLKVPEETIREGQTIPQTLKTYVPEQSETLRPDLAIYEPGADPKPRLLIQIYPHGTDLEKPLSFKHWKAMPATRMMELLHGTDCRLGLITNGERWMLVDAPRGESTGFASWYASLWLEEQITLRSFRSLLSGHRFFAVAAEETLEAMLAESAVNQQEVTEQLGYQVRQAVEVLVESIDKADQDCGRELAKGISEKVLYEAALAVMMRLVFLMSAEERKLLLLGDPIYDQHYAISTLQAQLRETADQHGEEILEHRFDAWFRLLATFRAVHAGMQHDRMTLPAYGGHLFDPDRYPFLEGRKSETSWKTTPASPLPVNNRTVLHALEALQFLQVKVTGGGTAERRRLSFRALDVEQIGYVYEGLLDHTAKRASDPILGLRGTKDKEPEIALAELERRLAESPEEFYSWLREETGRSESVLKNALTAELEGHDVSRFHAACGNDNALWTRVKAFAGLVRDDTFGYPVIVHPGSVYVTEGEDRRTTGTQYTPRSLTGPVVRHTLEPLVYVGPAEGEPRDKWQLRSAADLLSLKICDMTCGSGAFLVETCRYLADRLLEAWDLAEKQYPETVRITPEGKPSSGDPAELLIPKDVNERQIYAQRLIAQQCLYGVDKNMLAVEMAKLSLWLLTLEQNRAFTFLDHAIKCGDSLLGVTRQEQVEAFDFEPHSTDEKQISLWKKASKVLFDRALQYRQQLEASPVMTVEDVHQKEELLKRAEQATSLVRLLCDLLTAAAISTATGKPPKKGDAFDKKRAVMWQVLMESYQYDENVESWRDALVSMDRIAQELLNEGKPFAGSARHPFHWPVEFPEVLAERGGFDAIVGNPPFMGGSKITGTLGTDYRNFLVGFIASGKRGSADLCTYFLLRSWNLLVEKGGCGLLATNSIAQGESLEVGLEQLLQKGAIIIRAISSRKWPGDANLEVAELWLHKGPWLGGFVVDGEEVPGITAQLTAPSAVAGTVALLEANQDLSFEGSKLLGIGFVLSPDEAQQLIAKDKRNRDVVMPYLVGEDINSRPDQSPSRWVINFHDWPVERAMECSDCFKIIETRVKPERTRKEADGEFSLRYPLYEKWWIYGEKRPLLYKTIASLQRVLVRSRVSAHHFVSFADKGVVLSDRLVVFAFDTFEAFALLGSTIHELWVSRPGSTTHETRGTYFPERSFQTFPFPESSATLRQPGEKYHRRRREITLGRQRGLTEIYNRFHNEQNHDDDITELRHLHCEMDYAVASVYGWKNLDLGHGFHQSRQGVRFTMSTESRRFALDKLLQLNQEHHAAEVDAGATAKSKKKRKKASVHEPTLF